MIAEKQDAWASADRRGRPAANPSAKPPCSPEDTEPLSTGGAQPAPSPAPAGSPGSGSGAALRGIPGTAGPGAARSGDG